VKSFFNLNLKALKDEHHKQFLFKPVTKNSHHISARHQLVGFSSLSDFSLDKVEQVERKLVLLIVQDRVQVSGGQQLIQELEHWERNSVNLVGKIKIDFLFL
jgi:hypothetical protein